VSGLGQTTRRSRARQSIDSIETPANDYDRASRRASFSKELREQSRSIVRSFVPHLEPELLRRRTRENVCHFQRQTTTAPRRGSLLPASLSRHVYRRPRTPPINGRQNTARRVQITCSLNMPAVGRDTWCLATVRTPRRSHPLWRPSSFCTRAGDLAPRLSLHVVITAAGKMPVRSRVTFETLANQWQVMVLPTYKPSTQKNHRHILGKHLMPRFGQKAVADVTRQEIKAYVAHLTKSGYAPKSVDHMHQRRCCFDVVRQAHFAKQRVTPVGVSGVRETQPAERDVAHVPDDLRVLGARQRRAGQGGRAADGSHEC
jgi:hypothetical protein